MFRLSRMINRMVLVRALGIGIGITVFILSLETLAYTKEIMGGDDGGMLKVLHYMILRMPSVLCIYLPIALLLGTLLTLTELSHRNELAAFWAMGISPLKLFLMLVPGALIIGALQFVLLDRAVPAAVPALRALGVGDYAAAQMKLGEQDPIWLKSGNDIVRAVKANANSNVMEDVIIFRRDSRGVLTHQVFAEKAVLKKDGWHLSTVITYRRDAAPPERSASALYKGRVRPAVAGLRAGDPEQMTWEQLGRFVANGGFGIRPGYFYETWRQKRLSPLAVVLAMTLLCVPLAAKFRRGGGLGVLFGLGIGIGFLFFVFEGISTSAGELGFVPPWMAVWTPVGLLTLFGLFLMLRTERVA